MFHHPAVLVNASSSGIPIEMTQAQIPNPSSEPGTRSAGVPRFGKRDSNLRLQGSASFWDLVVPGVILPLPWLSLTCLTWFEHPSKELKKWKSGGVPSQIQLVLQGSRAPPKTQNPGVLPWKTRPWPGLESFCEANKCSARTRRRRPTKQGRFEAGLLWGF